MITGYPAFREALADTIEFEREIGSGATATVFLARDLKHQRRVAVKMLWPEFVATLAAERFLREIGIAAQLQHPHILPLLDSGEAAGSLYFTMPFVEGETLRQRVNREGPLGISDTIRILGDVADALVYAHEHGVVHRDIKPDNIMLVGRNAVVMDFGVASAASAAQTGRQLTAGIAIGTPNYMAPEQAMADPAFDHRVDIYALGVLGYELLTGQPPFVRATPQEVLAAHVAHTPELVTVLRSDIPQDLADIIMRSLEKRPDERWQSAAEITERLDPLTTPMAGMTPARQVPMTGRNTGLRWVVGAIALVSVVTLVVRLVIGSDPNQPPDIRPEQLTFAGNVIESAISLDGQFLAFVGRLPDREELFVQDLSTGTVVSLATANRIEAIAWAGNASEVGFNVVDSAKVTLMTASRLGGPARVLRRGFGLRSPDGSKIAVASKAGLAVTIIDARTGDSTLFERSPAYTWVSGLSWSANSDQLIVAVSSQSGSSAIMSYSPEGVETVSLVDTVDVFGPVWDPSGPALWYLRGETEVGADLYRLRVLPDGRPSGEPIRVAAGLALEVRGYTVASSPLSITRDGGQLVYSRRDMWSNLGTLQLDGGAFQTPQFLTTGTALYYSGHVSPDGGSVAVQVQGISGTTVGVVPTTGGSVQEIATLNLVGYVSWSDNGGALAFVGASGPVGWGLAVYDFDRGATRWFRGVRLGAGVSSRDSAIFATTYANRYIYQVDPATSQTRIIGPSDTTGFVFHPRVSPDGRLIAFSWNRQGRRQLHVMSVDGGTTRMLADVELRPLAWANDGLSLYAATHRVNGPETVFRVPVTGDPATALYVLTAGLSAEDLFPDKRTLLINQIQGRSDAVALNLSMR